MEARCTCTIEEQGPGTFVRPDAGYRKPNPHCVHCGGKGFVEVTMPSEKEIKAVWIGICPICGFKNGVHLQLKRKLPPVGRRDAPPCLNEGCSRERVSWVKIG
jgi:hypothetical protein